MTAQPDQLPFTGIHHLALVTGDLEATTHFYCDILGMRLILSRRDKPGRHRVFDLGGGDTLHFWEEPKAEIFTDPIPGSPWTAGSMQHIALRVPDADALQSLQSRLRAAGVEVSESTDRLSVQSIYLKDNNGIDIEIARWKTDPTGKAPQYDNPLFFSQTEELLAMREAGIFDQVSEA